MRDESLYVVGCGQLMATNSEWTCLAMLLLNADLDALKINKIPSSFLDVVDLVSIGDHGHS